MHRGKETEIKLVVHDLRSVRRQIARLGFVKVRSRHFENDVLLDFPDFSLWRSRCLLRLRCAGGEWALTFKGAPLASRHYKVRREVETAVADGDKLQAILVALGLRAAFRYEKYRTIYAEKASARNGHAAQVVLDETPIGNYLELEGPRRWIDRVAAGLGYRREDYITASYAALYREKCRARGEQPGHMLFAPRKRR